MQHLDAVHEPDHEARMQDWHASSRCDRMRDNHCYAENQRILQQYNEEDKSHSA